MNQQPCYLLIGLQGSGKGTQADKLSKILNIPIISTGNLLRKVREEDSKLGKTVKHFYDEGVLAPDEITLAVIKQEINQSDLKNGIVFEGFPRNLNQLDMFIKLIADHDLKIDAFLLDIDDETTIKRTGNRLICDKCSTPHSVSQKPKECENCGGELITRTDDNPVAITKRLESYYQETQPVVDKLYRLGLLTMIDGELSEMEVTRRIMKNIRAQA